MSAYPPDIAYLELTVDDFRSLKKLGQQCLPIPYPDKYWQMVASDSTTHYSLGAYNPKKELVGAIGVVRNAKKFLATKLLNPDEQKLIDTYRKVCYITTLVVSPEYRKIGIATQLLQRASTVLLEEGSHLIYLHVLHTNLPAIKLYEKMGYDKIAVLPDYYKINDAKEAGFIYCRRLTTPACHECIANRSTNCIIL